MYPLTHRYDPHPHTNAVVKTGVISQAAGSAYVELAKTKVMCGVYGPRQPQRVDGMEFGRGRLDVDVKLATFATAGARGKVAQGDAEREFSQLVHRALAGAVILETFPKTSVDVYVTVLEAGGAEREGDEGDVAGVHGLQGDAGGGGVDVDVGDEVLDGFDDFLEDERLGQFCFEHGMVWFGRDGTVLVQIDLSCSFPIKVCLKVRIRAKGMRIKYKMNN